MTGCRLSRSRWYPSSWLRFCAVAVAMAALSGCTDTAGVSDGDSADEAESKTAHVEAERGPVRVTVDVEPHPVQLSGEPTLTLTIEHEQGVTVDKPPFGEALGDFLIRDFRQPLPQTKGDRTIARYIYRLEPTRTGTQQIHPITVTFTDNRANGDGKKHELQTEALEVEVESVIGTEAPSLDDLEPPAGPIELAEPPSTVGWWGLSGLLVAAAMAFAVWRLLRRREQSEVVTLSPKEHAFLELQALIEAELAETDVKRFYVELTGIVRRYIERTTGVHAPEQTTEEFLHEIGGNDVFALNERTRLKGFLESADLVKFAKYQPRASDISESFERAKAFIGLDHQEAVA